MFPSSESTTSTYLEAILIGVPIFWDVPNKTTSWSSSINWKNSKVWKGFLFPINVLIQKIPRNQIVSTALCNPYFVVGILKVINSSATKTSRGRQWVWCLSERVIIVCEWFYYPKFTLTILQLSMILLIVQKSGQPDSINHWISWKGRWSQWCRVELYIQFRWWWIGVFLHQTNMKSLRPWMCIPGDVSFLPSRIHETGIFTYFYHN